MKDVNVLGPYGAWGSKPLHEVRERDVFNPEGSYVAYIATSVGVHRHHVSIYAYELTASADNIAGLRRALEGIDMDGYFHLIVERVFKGRSALFTPSIKEEVECRESGK